MKSNSNYSFSQVPQIQKERSVFNRSHGHKTTFNAGDLVPVYVDEVLPGDTMNLKMTCFGRFTSPLVQPVMDNMFVDVFFFFVPNRLLWENWEGLQGERAPDDIGHDDRFLVPVIGEEGDDGYFKIGVDVGDYFGLPSGSSADPDAAVRYAIGGRISALPFRAYNLIYNEWFRDENLCPKAYEATDDGPDDWSYPVLKRCKRHDYFTSALLWAQKGNGVDLPLGGFAPVLGTGKQLGLSDGHQDLGLFNDASSNTARNFVGSGETVGAAISGGSPSNSGKVIGVTTDLTKSGLIADLNLATVATINELRLAFQLQRALERDARGGTRYTEILRSHWGVISPDSRLQRPEYLGGGTVPFKINSVPQTSATGVGDTPQATLAAFGVFSGRMGFNQSFVEHGWIMGIACLRADLTYQQGIPRMFSRRTRFDFYLPVLAHLGEQEILGQELVYMNDDTKDLGPWGYQERWAEYRYYPSKITGQLRSNAVDSLDVWHLSQAFLNLDGSNSLPGLNQSFIEENPPMDRVLTVLTSNAPNVVFDSLFEIRHARPLPVFSVPGLIDHF